MSNERDLAKLYDSYRNTRVWRVVEEAIDNLVRNQDIVEQTPREYVVGYQCMRLNEMRDAEAEAGRD